MRKHRKLLAETLRSRRIQLVFGLVSVGGLLLLFHHQTATNEFEVIRNCAKCLTFQTQSIAK